MTFIDLFAGAGGLSEGFIRAGFTPIAHIEMDKYACHTLRTRAAFHYLRENNQLDIYEEKKQFPGRCVCAAGGRREWRSTLFCSCRCAAIFGGTGFGR